MVGGSGGEAPPKCFFLLPEPPYLGFLLLHTSGELRSLVLASLFFFRSPRLDSLALGTEHARPVRREDSIRLRIFEHVVEARAADLSGEFLAR